MSGCCSSSALAPLQSMRQPLCCVNIGRSVTQHAVTRPGPTMRLMITIAAVMYASRFSSKLSSGSGPLPRPTQLGSEALRQGDQGHERGCWGSDPASEGASSPPNELTTKD